MSQPHKNAFGLDLLLRVTFCWKEKKKINPITKEALAFQWTLTKPLSVVLSWFRFYVVPFTSYYDKMFSLTFPRYNSFPYSKNKKKKTINYLFHSDRTLLKICLLNNNKSLGNFLFMLTLDQKWLTEFQLENFSHGRKEKWRGEGKSILCKKVWILEKQSAHPP